MFEKLEALTLRYEDLSRELASPDIAANQERFRTLMKEQSDLAPLIDTYARYKQADQDRKSTRLNSSHPTTSRMPSSA